MKELDSYIINYETLAIVPNDNNSSIIYEEDNDFVVRKDCFSIVKDSCLYFGSTFEGRKCGAKDYLNCQFKVPIIIEDSKNLIVFPTSSYRRKDTIWIAYQNLLDYKKSDVNDTILYFKNSSTLKINVKYNIIDNQFIRCVKFNDLANKRKNIFVRE
jgi:competence protein ComK